MSDELDDALKQLADVLAPVGDPLLDMLAANEKRYDPSTYTDKETAMPDYGEHDAYVNALRNLREALTAYEGSSYTIKGSNELIKGDNLLRSDANRLCRDAKVQLDNVFKLTQGHEVIVNLTVSVTGTFNAITGFLVDTVGSIESIDDLSTPEGEDLAHDTPAAEHIIEMIHSRDNTVGLNDASSRARSRLRVRPPRCPTGR
jgi:hypothetical protein